MAGVQPLGRLKSTEINYLFLPLIMVVKKSMSMVKNDGIVEETIVLEIPIFQVFTE